MFAHVHSTGRGYFAHAGILLVLVNNDTSGIVGLSTAIHIMQSQPNSKVLILEKGVLPQGGSTKNAGFACFGSLSELIHDLKTHSSEEVIELVRLRWQGLNAMRELLGDDQIGYEGYGGYEIFLDKGRPKYTSNNSGGVLGGISTGQEIKLSIALKPTSSINKEGQTIDSGGESKRIQVKGRHDPCVGVRATPIAEAMTALVIMDHFLRNRAQNADVVTEIPDIS